MSKYVLLLLILLYVAQYYVATNATTLKENVSSGDGKEPRVLFEVLHDKSSGSSSIELETCFRGCRLRRIRSLTVIVC